MKSLFNKVAGLQPWTSLTRDTNIGILLWILKTLRTAFSIEDFQRLLLNGEMEKVKKSKFRECSVNVLKQPPEILFLKSWWNGVRYNCLIFICFILVLLYFYSFQSSQMEVFLPDKVWVSFCLSFIKAFIGSFKIGVLKTFTGKHLCWSLILVKLQAWFAATLLKRDSF